MLLSIIYYYSQIKKTKQSDKDLSLLIKKQ